MSQLLLCLLVFLALVSTILSSSTRIPLGSTLYASNRNHSWSSPNSTFALSFVPIGPASYVAAITYAGGVRVWSAGGDTGTGAAAVDSGGALRLLPGGSLRLSSGSGATVWDSATVNRGVSYASLDDSGNLALLNIYNSPVWSSFENPTDTVVPSQNFTVGNILRSGSYSFSLLRSGNLTLRWNNSIVYWSQGFNSSITMNLTSPSLSLQSNGILMGSDPSFSSGIIVAYSTDYGEGNENDVFRFLRLDGDGNLRIYSTTSSGNMNVTMTWAAVIDQCQVFGYCGNMGICSYNDENPVCGCAFEKFEPVDMNDHRKGCKRKVDFEDCPGNITMLEMRHAKFLTYPTDLSTQTVIVGIGACKSNCLVSASCVASTSMSDGSGSCHMKTPDFVSGYQSPAIPSTSFIKVCGPVLPNPSPFVETTGKCNTRNLHLWIVAVIAVSAMLILVALLSGIFWWSNCRNGAKFGLLSTQYALVEYASGAPVQFSYRELQQSTKGFKEVIGAGGFGTVYKGILANRMTVAVKQLEGIEQGERQFRMEVATISSTHHLNLVRLIGFCSHGRHRLLVYEFMKNGSLDNCLFATEEQSAKMLNWDRRFNVALGTARGITYLHEECRDCIVHCDIKPENILLDENHNPKVSDFGLAKLINSKDQRFLTLTNVRGTRGYLAPEWLANLPITSKSDVYSYGMVLLEIVSGRRNFEVSAETNHRKFSVWAYEEFEKGNLEGIVDKRLADEDVDMEQLVRAIQVSFWCIQEQPSQRPTMGKVVQMLEGVVEIERPPPREVVAEGPVSGTSITSAASAPAASSSFQTTGVMESSSLLASEGNDAHK